MYFHKIFRTRLGFSRFLRQASGSTAIEFALLVLPFLLCVFAMLEVGYKALVQAELDRMLTDVMSDIALRSVGEATAANYVNGVICARFPSSLITCSEVLLGAQKVDGRLINYRSQTIGGRWSPGCGGDTVLVELTYPLINITNPIVIADIVTIDGKDYYRSRGIVRREPVFSDGASC
jgi:Flp pilus assembly pilin Flp